MHINLLKTAPCIVSATDLMSKYGCMLIDLKQLLYYLVDSIIVLTSRYRKIGQPANTQVIRRTSKVHPADCLKHVTKPTPNTYNFPRILMELLNLSR